MNAKHTWTWLFLAGALFAFIFFFERHWGQPPSGPAPLLPGLKPAEVTRLVIGPFQQREIRIEITNANWWLTQPMLYPAEKSRVEELLTGLSQLLPAQAISRSEIQRRPKAEEEFGFDNPRTTLTIHQGQEVTTLKFGRPTAPGDQVFLQIVGREDVFVVDAALAKLLPASADDWRDAALVDLRTLKFDTISITNAGRLTRFQIEATNHSWRMTDPLQARADGDYLLAMLRQLQATRVSSFVPEERRPDLDALGLQPAGLSLTFAQGNTTVAALQFGRTNSAGQSYARRDDLNAVVTVPVEALTVWRQDLNAFRERRLVALPPELAAVELRETNGFTLERTGTNQWRVAGEKFPTDRRATEELLERLNQLEIVKFVQDVVSAADLGRYGLTSAVRQITLKLPAAAGSTNAVATQIAFGNVEGEIIYARRSDEDAIYALRLADVRALPVAGWQLRDAQIGSVPGAEVVRLTLRKGNWSRELIRNGTNSWGFAPGSQGVMDVECTEEIARQLGQLNATAWIARGAAAAEDRRFGFATNSLTVAWESRAGAKQELQFGGYSRGKHPFARVTLDGEPWVLEFPSAVFEFMLNCCSIPPGAP